MKKCMAHAETNLVEYEIPDGGGKFPDGGGKNGERHEVATYGEPYDFNSYYDRDLIDGIKKIEIYIEAVGASPGSSAEGSLKKSEKAEGGLSLDGKLKYASTGSPSTRIKRDCLGASFSSP